MMEEYITYRDDDMLRVIFEELTREQVAYLLALTKDLGHERTVDVISNPD